jgi:hypothetical protein
MKKSSAIAIAPATMSTSLVTTKMAMRNQRRQVKGLLAQQTAPPSEETIKRLNGIGREYPFCVYYKSKRYDPL